MSSAKWCPFCLGLNVIHDVQGINTSTGLDTGVPIIQHLSVYGIISLSYRQKFRVHFPERDIYILLRCSLSCRLSDTKPSHKPPLPPSWTHKNWLQWDLRCEKANIFVWKNLNISGFGFQHVHWLTLINKTSHLVAIGSLSNTAPHACSITCLGHPRRSASKHELIHWYIEVWTKWLTLYRRCIHGHIFEWKLLCFHW